MKLMCRLLKYLITHSKMEKKFQGRVYWHMQWQDLTTPHGSCSFLSLHTGFGPKSWEAWDFSLLVGCISVPIWHEDVGHSPAGIQREPSLYIQHGDACDWWHWSSSLWGWTHRQLDASVLALSTSKLYSLAPSVFSLPGDYSCTTYREVFSAQRLKLVLPL